MNSVHTATPPREVSVKVNAQHQTGPDYADESQVALQAALQSIAERARISTAASGVAISLGDRDGMVCRASAGTAPDVGAHLRPDEGLSGYCLRKADIVLCADAQSDPRVDASAARRLDLGSMVVMPVFVFGRLAGVLQALSPRPHAFDNSKVMCLAHFAQALSSTLEHRQDLSKIEIAPGATNVKEQSRLPSPEAPVAKQEQPASPFFGLDTERSELSAFPPAPPEPKSPDVQAAAAAGRNENRGNVVGHRPAKTEPRPKAPVVSAKARTPIRSGLGSRSSLHAAGVVVLVVMLLAVGRYVMRQRAGSSTIKTPAPTPAVSIPAATKAEPSIPSAVLESGAPTPASSATESRADWPKPAAPLETNGTMTAMTKVPIPEATGKVGASRSSNAGPIRTLRTLAGKMKQLKIDDIAALEKRAVSGDPEARVILGLAYTQGSLLKKDPAKAIGWYRQAAKQAYAPAEEALGLAYLLGSGVPKNGVQAVLWYTRAAEHGSVMGANELGAMYSSGDTVPKNFGEALKWYRVAAERGDATAQYNLARMYHLGQGAPADPALEFQWLRKAADQGFPAAQYNLALMYQEGKVVQADPGTAVRLLREAAGQGYTLAQTNLGYVYLKGVGVPVDYAQSLKWYRMAAEQGESLAAYALSVRYLSGGNGVAQDYSEAAKWSRVAAEKGHPDAQYNLGLLYASGKGVTKDVVAACKWLALSEEPGSSDEIRALQKEMTPGQISDAQHAIDQWRSAHQRP